VSALSVAAIYDTRVPVGACGVEAIVRVEASELGEAGVDASLRLWTPLGAAVIVLRELSPATEDLRSGAIRLDDRTVHYPAGRWIDGAREYELAIALPARDAGDQMLAARLSVVVGEEVVGRAPIAVAWTDDERLIAASGRPARSTRTGAAAAADLPTGPSPRPRHTLAGGSPAGRPCPVCGHARCGRRPLLRALRPRARRPSEVVRCDRGGGEDRLREPGALLVLGQFGEAEALEQDA